MYAGRGGEWLDEDEASVCSYLIAAQVDSETLWQICMVVSSIGKYQDDKPCLQKEPLHSLQIKTHGRLMKIHLTLIKQLPAPIKSS